uniref:DUF2905 domain-containing protein n=1 Tax=Heterorhabditis bacteriophora TaxID=37862 RepID=A0A1I7WL86_HETBA
MYFVYLFILFQLIGRISENLLGAILLLLALFACIGLVSFLGVNLYRKRILLNKKNEAADSSVSFHGNVISFSNPVLDSKQDLHPVEYSMQQISSSGPGSTTFSNPVYDLEGRAGHDVIAPKADLTKPAIPPRPLKSEKDKNIMVENPVYEVQPDEFALLYAAVS